MAERGRGDDMAALEAAADAAGGTRLSGFVSAGVIQQQAPGDGAPAAPGALRATAWHCCCYVILHSALSQMLVSKALSGTPMLCRLPKNFDVGRFSGV